jgi:hypothetical protein
MRAVLPLHLANINESKVGFVDQRRCLKRVAHTLARHVTARDAAEFSMNERNQLFERRIVALAPREEETGDLGRRNAARIPPPFRHARGFYAGEQRAS